MLPRVLRSPFIPMILFLFVILGFVLSSIGSTTSIRIFFGIILVFVILWVIFIQIHNRQNPDHPINSWGIIPPEFREMDEGQQWITFKACRSVYIYYTFALPVAAVVCFIFSSHHLVPLLCIGALGLGQYLVYWLTIRKFS
ncbi:hypothetical protein CFK37_18505 [Virgibacillus phasianinus]|uniref:Uncharacterized protein n=1 Tax=Virgibacillus phasianinus TaxID=2017483 RepID=A0A220U6S3_9BACI|nr:hypothetical protein [Virgibacillus phasianinus]ASK64004.1 hypothetical protein CFK37_18505 [Virgibacillus phasianinus]